MDHVVDALSIINTARSAFGASMLADLPGGSRGASTDCVLARAFSDLNDGGHQVSVSDKITFPPTDRGRRAAQVLASITGMPMVGDTAVKCPPSLNKLWREFDDGQGPARFDVAPGVGSLSGVDSY